MCTMFMSPNMEGDYTCSILYICGDIPLVSWLIWHVLAGAPCEGIKVPVKGLGSTTTRVFVWTSTPIVAGYDFETISRKSAVGARERVSLLCMTFSNGKGCIAWSTSVHIC